jgi:hypothetical protein
MASRAWRNHDETATAMALENRYSPIVDFIPRDQVCPHCRGAGIKSLDSDIVRMLGFYLGQDSPSLALERELTFLSDWQRRHLPNIHSLLGQQMIAWLIRNYAKPKPFSHLLASTSFSTTSVRHLLNQFAVLGLVEISKASGTCRRGDIVAATKLRERLEEYAELIAAVVTHHGGVDFNPPHSEPSQSFFDRVTST